MKINRHSMLAVSISLCLSSTAYSGGFTVTVQSASGGGTAATNHAMAEDASAMFYNPALLSSIEGTQVNGGISLTSPDMTVTNVGSENPSAAFGTPVIGTNTAEPTDLSATPSLYYKRDVSPHMAFGLGINVPHGVSSEYEETSFARYEATESALTALNINPALSWKVSDHLSIGAGLNLQYATAKLARSVDSRLLCSGIGAAAAADPRLNATQQAAVAAAANAATACGGLAPSNSTTDGSSTVEATGFSYGLNVGAAYRPSNATTISVGLRSAVKHELEGDVDFDFGGSDSALIKALDNFGKATGQPAAPAGVVANGILTQAGYLDRDATSELEIPATASLAFATKMNSKLTLHGDVTWTDWSSVPEIRIEFPAAPPPAAALSDSVTSLKWEDTVRVGAGMTYQLSDKTKLRAGVAYDPTPTPGAANRTPRAPSSDTIWLAVGMGHKFSKKLSLDASLAYIHLEDMKIDYRAPSSTTDYLTRANAEADAFSAALSLNYRFK